MPSNDKTVGLDPSPAQDEIVLQIYKFDCLKKLFTFCCFLFTQNTVY